ncbi:hypothetical protein [Pseudomonas tohonis]|uniref:hypothetical protein n=1 Tax=Pseudomonas tohonis TaxID=2725477 RepID=UPI0022EFEB0C|nr:hypothetical protein [Pseudomonas tohonis]
MKAFVFMIWICLWLVFLLMEKNRSNGSVLLNALFEMWSDSIMFDGSGCIDLHLDAGLAGDEILQSLKILIDTTMQELSMVSNVYPKDKLNLILAKANIRLENDYRVDLICDVLEKLRRLVD